MDPVVTARAPGRNGARRLVPRLLAPVAAIAVAGAGLPVSGLGTLDVVALALTIAWALAGAVQLVADPAPERSDQWQVALGALTAAVALTEDRIAGQPFPLMAGALIWSRRSRLRQHG